MVTALLLVLASWHLKPEITVPKGMEVENKFL